MSSDSPLFGPEILQKHCYLRGEDTALWDTPVEWEVNRCNIKQGVCTHTASTGCCAKWQNLRHLKHCNIVINIHDPVRLLSWPQDLRTQHQSAKTRESTGARTLPFIVWPNIRYIHLPAQNTHLPQIRRPMLLKLHLSRLKTYLGIMVGIQLLSLAYQCLKLQIP